MISIDEAARLIVAVRDSGRLRDADQPLMARALGLILERRAAFPQDPEEALVQAIASLVVIDAKKNRG